MKIDIKRYIKLFLCVFAFLKPEIGHSTKCDSSLTLIIDPIAKIYNVDPRPTDLVDVRIENEFKTRYPKILYDYLHQCEEFDLRTQFDELIRIKEQIVSDTREGFIKGVMDSIHYKPEAYLFTSIYKTIDKVEFRAEIVDLSTKSLAVASSSIGFTEFFSGDLVQKKIEEIRNSLCNCSEKNKWGLVKISDYLNEHRNHPIGIGLGFGYRKGDQVALGNVPSDVRMTSPHPDDVRNRPDQILDPNVPDNYLVRENTVIIDLGHRMSLDVNLSLWGIVNIAIRTSSIQGSEKIYDRNLFRKNYIRPGFTGDAFIYYSVRSKNRQFFDRESFSLPVYLTYPVFYYGSSKELVFRILGGTNILLPEKIEFVAEQGWDRFGALETPSKRDIGELKEIQWFGGVDIEGSPTVFFKLGIQFILIFADYQENFSVPLSLQLDKSVHYSLRVTATKLFEW